MSNRIIISSHDTEYINRIEMEVVTALRKDVTIIFATSVEYLREIEREGIPADCLFIDDKMLRDIKTRMPVRRVCRITDDGTSSETDVRKIDGAAALLKRIDSVFLQDAAELEKRQTRIVHVFSLAGGSGKTLTSLGVAQSLSKRGWKVLYVNMDSLQDFHCFLGDKKSSFASETLAITFASENASQSRNLMSEVVNEGFDYIPPFRQFLDAYALTGQQIERAAIRIADAAVYDMIVLEHPAGMQEAMISPIRQGDRRVFIGTQSALCAERLRRITELNPAIVGDIILVNGCSKERDLNHLGIAARECGLTICEKIRVTENPDPFRMESDGVFENTVNAVLLQ